MMEELQQDLFSENNSQGIYMSLYCFLFSNVFLQANVLLAITPWRHLLILNCMFKKLVLMQQDYTKKTKRKMNAESIHIIFVIDGNSLCFQWQVYKIYFAFNQNDFSRIFGNIKLTLKQFKIMTSFETSYYPSCICLLYLPQYAEVEQRSSVL